MPEPVHPSALQPYVSRALADEAWCPATARDAGAQTIPRQSTFSSTAVLVSGTLQLIGGVVLRPGRAYSTITFLSGGTAAGTPTAQWFCAVRLSDRAVLGKTADDGATAWGTFTSKSLTLATPIEVADFTPVYLGVVVAAATPNSLFGLVPSGSYPGNSAPILCGASTAGLTNPASLGATAAALTANSTFGYAAIA